MSRHSRSICAIRRTRELPQAALLINLLANVDGRGVFEDRFNGALNRLWRRHEHSKYGGARLLGVHGV